MRAALNGAAPAVAVEFDDDSVAPLLGAAELEACNGQVDALIAAVDTALAALTGD